MEYLFVISGTIGSWWSCSVDAEYIRWQLAKNKDKEVHVGFCSPGGSVAEGLEMYQAFKDHGNVHAHAFGMNASISTIAMLGCKTIDIVKGSFFLIHNASIMVDKWESQNKEKMQAFIKELQVHSEELATIDDVLAQLYAEKTGKTVEEIKKQMDKGSWMSAQQALDFGLVDSIREDEKTEKAAACICTDFTNHYTDKLKDAGIPPLPLTDDTSVAIAAVADEEGNPTPSFLRKTWQGLQNLLSNQQASKINNSMITIFAKVMALLSITDGFKPNEDGTISLSQDQMKAIDDQLANQAKTLDENATAMKAAADSIKELKDKVAKLESDVKDRDEQIKNLQGAPGAQDPADNNGADGAENVSSQDLFNLIKDI